MMVIMLKMLTILIRIGVLFKMTMMRKWTLRDRPNQRIVASLATYILYSCLLFRSISETKCLSFSLSSARGYMNRFSIPGSIVDTIEEAGYKAEIYNIGTQDGYKINLARIVNPLINRINRQAELPKEPVLLIHGIFVNAKVWIAMGSAGGKPHDWVSRTDLNPANATYEHLVKNIGKDTASRSLPFLLSNFGYDVWLMNRRPSYASRRASNERDSLDELEVTRPPLWQELLAVLPETSTIEGALTSLTLPIFGRASNSYWHFSFDEQALIDLPLVIDYILNKTQAQRMNLIGHSAGGMMIGMMLADKPEIANKVKHVSLLAASANLHYSVNTNPFVLMIKEYEVFQSQQKGPFDMVTFMPKGIIYDIADCIYRAFRLRSCATIMDKVVGIGNSQFDSSRMLAILPSIQARPSNQELFQLVQASHRNQFSYYDYGHPEENKQMYGQFDVPSYDMSKINVTSLSIWQGNTDTIINDINTQTFLNSLKANYTLHVIGDEEKGILFNHVAFHFHKDTTTLINIPILMELARAP